MYANIANSEFNSQHSRVFVDSHYDVFFKRHSQTASTHQRDNVRPFGLHNCFVNRHDLVPFISEKSVCVDEPGGRRGKSSGR